MTNNSLDRVNPQITVCTPIVLPNISALRIHIPDPNMPVTIEEINIAETNRDCAIWMCRLA